MLVKFFSRIISFLRLLAHYPYFKSVFFSCRIGPRTVFRGIGNISLGKNVSFVGDSFISSIGGEIIIKNNVHFNRNAFINADIGGFIEIGTNVIIGPNFVIRASDHSFHDINIPFLKQNHKPGNITIGENVWIASNVVILNNIKIGSNIVIGSGSVVTKNIYKSGLYCGNPAIYKRALKK